MTKRLAGMGAAAPAVRVGTGSTGVLGVFRKSDVLDESVLSLARSQPF